MRPVPLGQGLAGELGDGATVATRLEETVVLLRGETVVLLRGEIGQGIETCA